MDIHLCFQGWEDECDGSGHCAADQCGRESWYELTALGPILRSPNVWGGVEYSTFTYI